MAGRHKSRILVMQFLFSLDINQAWDDFDTAMAIYCNKFNITTGTVPHFFTVALGVKEHQVRLETLIAESTENWKLSRMSGVDRNILRIAVFEMLYCEDVPPKAAINEAIEIGKRFGTEESGGFINGVLDKIHQKLQPYNVET